MKRSLIAAAILAVSTVSLSACTSEPPRPEAPKSGYSTPEPFNPDIEAISKRVGEEFSDAVIAFRKKHRVLPEGSNAKITKAVSDPFGAPLYDVMKLTKFTPREDGTFTFTLTLAKDSWDFDSKKIRPDDGGHIEDAKEPNTHVEPTPGSAPLTAPPASPSPK